MKFERYFMRLVVAFLASAGLHVVLAGMWHEPKQAFPVAVQSGTGISVELMPVLKSATPVEVAKLQGPLPEHVEEPAPAKQAHALVREKPPAALAQAPLLSVQDKRHELTEVTTLEEKSSENVSDHQADKKSMPQNNEAAGIAAAVSEVEQQATAASLSEDMKAKVMAHIRYPRMAQRMGWQGVASFDLDIRSQQLARLDLRRSSGYEVLDQAAMRGIRAIGSLPLADGVYQLPVEFRLQ